MTELIYKTRGNASPQGKPKVYFTCHPDDFTRYFDKICEDIFKTHDCAIYYTEDMTAELDEKYRTTDLGSINLFVVPVTFRLLTKPNRAMDSDIAYALKEHVPTLPFMMESGIDEWYSRPDKFGELQYINPYSRDLTEISYEEKLKKYLESVLISDEMAKRVRAAFYAYIFLSYRKKDRHHANELMRIIHSKPEFRDIAIWYDEFLTPGESFRENIERMLKNSKLFTLLVTPNLLEEPNFVMGEEYPLARNTGMKILPAEMEETDKEALGEKFKGIPGCIDSRDGACREQLLDSISKVATTASDNDPEHNYLIGLAYLEGIDVEVDRERGVELITKAAEAELPEAMEKLYWMYYEGRHVTLDYGHAIFWAEWLAVYNTKILGEDHLDTLTALHNLAIAYNKLANYEKALSLREEAYERHLQILDKHTQDSLASKTDILPTAGILGNYVKALEVKERIYEIRLKIFGEEHPDTLASMHNVAVAYTDLGNYEMAYRLAIKVYALRLKILGDEHPDTITSMSSLAGIFSGLHNHEKALEFGKKVYALRYKILGDEHPDTITSMNSLAEIWGELGNYEKAIELSEKEYALCLKIFGAEHLNTLDSLNALANKYSESENIRKALELWEIVYTQRCRILGEEHPDTLSTLGNIVSACDDLGQVHRAVKFQEKLYDIRCKILGEEHATTLIELRLLVFLQEKIQNYNVATDLLEKAYDIMCRNSWRTNHDIINVLYDLSHSYARTGRYYEAIQGFEKVYAFRSRTLGKEDSETIKAKEMLEITQNQSSRFFDSFPPLPIL